MGVFAFPIKKARVSVPGETYTRKTAKIQGFVVADTTASITIPAGATIILIEAHMWYKMQIGCAAIDNDITVGDFLLAHNEKPATVVEHSSEVFAVETAWKVSGATTFDVKFDFIAGAGCGHAVACVLNIVYFT